MHAYQCTNMTKSKNTKLINHNDLNAILLPVSARPFEIDSTVPVKKQLLVTLKNSRYKSRNIVF